jgi:voltage-gated potassium channel Kch
MTRYVFSLYWAMATITTVGYGDIAPYTKKERAFGIIYMIVAGGLFSVIIGSMNSFIENLYAEDEEFEK